MYPHYLLQHSIGLNISAGTHNNGLPSGMRLTAATMTYAKVEWRSPIPFDKYRFFGVDSAHEDSSGVVHLKCPECSRIEDDVGSQGNAIKVNSQGLADLEETCSFPVAKLNPETMGLPRRLSILAGPRRAYLRDMPCDAEMCGPCLRCSSGGEMPAGVVLLRSKNTATYRFLRFSGYFREAVQESREGHILVLS